MENTIIKGIILSEFDDIYGPKAKYYIPEDLPVELLNTVSGITIDSFFSENVKSEALILVPFPMFQRKGVVKLFEWKDSELRGGRGNAALTVLYEDKDDAIFYKYIDDFEPPFKNAIPDLISLLRSHESADLIISKLESFQSEFFNLLGSLADHELHLKEQVAFPTISSPQNGSLDYRFKLVIIGDPSVGKSSTILRYTDKAFRRSYISTIGVNITEKRVEVDKTLCQLIFWDCAGQIKYQHIRQMYYQGAVGILIVYDITNHTTLESVKGWYHDVKMNLEEPQYSRFVLCGNKKDKIQEAVVSTEEGQALANELDMAFFETSALTGENIEEAINNLVSELLIMFKEHDL
jgi:Ras-related protein Rab-8A